MKILILGGTGKIGSVVAWDLARERAVKKIGIAGRRRSSLQKTKKWVNSGKIVTHTLDVNHKEKTRRLIKQYDVAVITLPDRKADYKAVEAVIDVGVDSVDVLEEYHRRPDLYETEGLDLPKGMSVNRYGEGLHKKACRNNVVLVDGMGFAPGLSNLTTGEGIRQMDLARSAIARVGGIPSKRSSERRPLKYMITWAFRHVLREYMVKVKIFKNGKGIEVDAMSDYESFKFTKLGKSEKLECFITPGMPSFIYTRPNLYEFTEKTIRWPGHWRGIQTLKECGLLELDLVKFQGIKFAPREFLLSVLEPRLRALKDDADVCVMWNTIKGKKDGKKIRIDYYMWEEADLKRGISAMGRVTAFPAAITARLLAQGKIKERGLVPPEDCIKGSVYKEFIRELRNKKITILEERG